MPSHFSIFRGGPGIVDFVELRLARMIALEEDRTDRARLRSLLRRYRRGSIAIGWDHGDPVELPATLKAIEEMQV